MRSSTMGDAGIKMLASASARTALSQLRTLALTHGEMDVMDIAMLTPLLDIAGGTRRSLDLSVDRLWPVNSIRLARALRLATELQCLDLTRTVCDKEEWSAVGSLAPSLRSLRLAQLHNGREGVVALAQALQALTGLTHLRAAGLLAASQSHTALATVIPPALAGM